MSSTPGHEEPDADSKGPVLQKLQDYWTERSSQQKAILVAAFLTTFLAIAGFAWVANRPSMSLLYGGLDAAQAAGVTVETQGIGGSQMVPGDPDQLVQIFQNLIENALKYGGYGGYLGVVMRRIDHEPLLRGPAWAVEIRDRGEGIEGMHLPRLTERFYRVDTHRSRAQGGTGLGLAIVKHIVSRHRGRLRIDSTRGQGSTFTVILPESASRG